MLRLSEGKLVAVGITMLVGEDNHQVGTLEVFRYFLRQTLQCCLVRYGSVTGGNYHEQVVWRYLRRQMRQLVPVNHRGIISKHFRMPVLDIFIDERQTLFSARKLDAAVEVAGKSG